MHQRAGVALAIGVPVAIAAIGWGVLNAVAAADTGHYSFSIPLTVSGGQLTADFPGSNVTIEPGGAARLAGTVSYSIVRPHLTVNDGKVSYPCAIPAGECGMTATLTVPPSATSVNVSTGGGSLTVPRGLTANVTLTTSGSNITANGLAGTANLDSGSGAINASGITASDVTANNIWRERRADFHQYTARCPRQLCQRGGVDRAAAWQLRLPGERRRRRRQHAGE